MPEISLPTFEQVNWHVPLNNVLTQLNDFVDQLASDVAELETGGGGAVSSVNGSTGAVVLDVDDISDTASTTRKYLTPAERTKLNNTSGTNTGDQVSVSGNAGTATRLQTPRTINGISFDGSANITINAIQGDGTIDTIVRKTQAQYDAIVTKDPDTLYIIVG